MDEKEDTRLGIQSVEIAADILTNLAQGGGKLPLNQLARRAGMSSGKVHRYLISLTRSGLVSQCQTTGHYQIGPLCLTLGLSGLRRAKPLQTALDAWPDLHDRLGETAVVAIWSDMGPTVVALEEGQGPVTMNVRVGSVLPMHSSAVGRVFAAFSPSSVTKTLLTEEFAKRPRRRAAPVGRPTRADFEAELARVRVQGYAVSAGELLPGVNAIAAPLFDYRGRLAAAIGVVGHEQNISIEPAAAVITELQEAAGRISQLLGYAPDVDAAPPTAAEA